MVKIKWFSKLFNQTTVTDSQKPPEAMCIKMNEENFTDNSNQHKYAMNDPPTLAKKTTMTVQGLVLNVQSGKTFFRKEILRSTFASCPYFSENPSRSLFHFDVFGNNI